MPVYTISIEAEQRKSGNPAFQASSAVKAVKKTVFKIGPGQLLGIVIGLILAVVIPGIGPFILLLTIINAIVKGFRSGLKSSG